MARLDDDERIMRDCLDERECGSKGIEERGRESRG